MRPRFAPPRSSVWFRPTSTCVITMADESSSSVSSGEEEHSTGATSEEEELCVLLLARKKTLERKKRRKMWIRPIFKRRKEQGEYHNLVQELRLDDSESHFKYMRMSKERFDYLLSMVC